MTTAATAAAAVTVAFLPDIAPSAAAVTVELGAPQLHEGGRETVLSGWARTADADRVPWPHCRLLSAVVPGRAEPVTAERAHVDVHQPGIPGWSRVTLRWASLPSPETAAALADRGLAVVPLPPGGRLPAPGWQRRASSDPERVRAMWQPGENIAVACRPSGIVGLDLDVEGDGTAVLADLAARRGEPWPQTLTVRTPSGGWHLYFAAPAGCTIGSFSGERSPLGPGIDVRGPGRRSGGYLIGPGSVVGGIPYRITNDAPIQPLPDWLATLLNTALTSTTRPSTGRTP